MIWRTIIGAVTLGTVLYYVVCLLEVFKIIKWTPPHIDIKFPQFLIPFYYFIKK